jgi:hypothetical protein
MSVILKPAPVSSCLIKVVCTPPDSEGRIKTSALPEDDLPSSPAYISRRVPAAATEKIRLSCFAPAGRLIPSASDRLISTTFFCP